MLASRNVIIFDFDGVLADSIDGLYNIYLNFLSDHGLQGNKLEFDELNGPTIREGMTLLKERYHLRPSVKELTSEYQERLKTIYQNTATTPQAQKIVPLLSSSGFKIALASSCNRNEINFFLNRYALSEYFDFIVTGDDVEHSKPSPEIYIRVKDHFQDADFMVIEDSDNGMKAAKAANLTTTFYNPEGRSSSVEFDFEIHQLEEILQLAFKRFFGCATMGRTSNITLKLVTPSPENFNFDQHKVSQIWAEQSKLKTLFNGAITCFQSIEQKVDSIIVECYASEYKYFLAQSIAPSLGINMKPVAVSGIIVDQQNNVLLGRRSGVTEYDGYLELVPSGGIDTEKTEDGKVLFEDQLREEFFEETEINTSAISSITPLCIIHDQLHDVIDICSVIRLNETFELDPQNINTEEYQDFMKVKIADLIQLLASENTVPTSMLLAIEYVTTINEAD